MPARVEESIKRFFGDLPVVDAKVPLRLQPNEDDIRGATPGNATECAFAQCCKRVYGSTAVYFWQTVAYVDLINDNGARQVERFKLDPPARRYIQDFDLGNPVSPAGFVLSPPQPSETMEARRIARREQKRRKRKAIAMGTYVASGRRNGGGDNAEPAWSATLLRNGSGMVHFTMLQTKD